MLGIVKKKSKRERWLVLMSSGAPFLIIGGLLYAGLFVKANAVVTDVAPKVIERRDSFFAIAAPTADVVWSAGTNGKIIRSDDGGASWVRQLTPSSVNLQGLAAWDAQRAVAVGNDGLILVTGDSGKTWTQAKVPELSNNSKLLRVRTFGNTAWAMGEFGALFSSNDFGASWVRALPEKDLGWNYVEFVGDNGWLVGEFGTIMKTADGGATWKQIVTRNNTSLMAVAFRDVRNGVAVGLSGTVLVTADGGNTWNQQPRTTKEHLYSVIWDENRWVAVGDKGVMLTAEAAAASWNVTRIAEKDFMWRTQIVRAGQRYYMAGARLWIMENGKLTVVGQSQG